jgi:sulfide:quinone oxidoreductase
MRHVRPDRMMRSMDSGAPRVLIAGGGVAGLEALLGLRHVLGPSAEIELIAPSEEFVLRPLLIGEPFGLGGALRLEMEEVAAEHGAGFRPAAVSAVEPAERSVRTGDGAEVPYDALLLAIGTRPARSVPGAIHFGLDAGNSEFERMLGMVAAGDVARIAMVAPSGENWTLAAYELALLTAAYAAEHGSERTRMVLVTHEQAPLEIFGSGSPAILRELLDEAGVQLLTGSPASHAEDGLLHLANGGEPIRADQVVALPRLEVPDLPGVPQRAGGFIPTDARMNVEGMTQVWAAGDATWFPIKQGGLAAQQADVAVSSIAGHLGVPTATVPYRPVLRGALVTGALPVYLRASLWGDRDADTSATSLWWPPGKVAGRYLTPYLARRRWGGDPATAISHLAPVDGERAEAERELVEAVKMCLSGAEADARAGDLRGALEWLDVVEEIILLLPPPWPDRRRAWRQALNDAERESAEAVGG